MNTVLLMWLMAGVYEIKYHIKPCGSDLFFNIFWTILGFIYMFTQTNPSEYWK